jgi:hypothetical protein
MAPATRLRRSVNPENGITPRYWPMVSATAFASPLPRSRTARRTYQSPLPLRPKAQQESAALRGMQRVRIPLGAHERAPRRNRLFGVALVRNAGVQPMSSRMFALLVAGCIVGASVPAWSQGGGGSGSGGAAGSSSGSGTAEGSPPTGTSSGPTTSNTQNDAGATRAEGNPSVSHVNSNTNADQSDAQTSTQRPQAQRNAGAGTAPNGKPIGTTGSGLGSPEDPIGGRK